MAYTHAFNSEAVKKICEAMGIDPKMTRRLILDFPLEGPIKLYVEMYVSDKTLDIDWKQALDGAQVITVGEKHVQD